VVVVVVGVGVVPAKENGFTLCDVPNPLKEESEAHNEATKMCKRYEESRR
jgi:hypothetical protein